MITHTTDVAAWDRLRRRVQRRAIWRARWASLTAPLRALTHRSVRGSSPAIQKDGGHLVPWLR